MKKETDHPYSKCYCLYCHDGSSSFYTEVSVIENAPIGITLPEYVSFPHNGIVKNGFLKKDENELNENDIEFVLTQIGRYLSIPMATVVRAYEDPLHTSPHSIISISVVKKNSEQFVSFSDMQSELIEDLKAERICITPWIEHWIQIRKRRNDNSLDGWDIPITSMTDCEACFCYPFEIAHLWTRKHDMKLCFFDEDILKMIMFDILVGQTDRTNSNYGLLVDWNQHTARLAPLFDNATLRKPNMTEWQNGFNHLLIDRTVFAVAAYQKWGRAFLEHATNILSKEHDIFRILESLKDMLPHGKQQFLKDRIRQSLDILNRIVRNHEKIQDLWSVSHVDELFLHREMRQIFNRHGMQPTDIRRIGDMGWEPKYRVATAKCDYFVKFSLYDRFPKEMLDLLKMVHQHVPSIAIPLISQNNPCIKRQINIYPWIEGSTIREYIRTKTPTESYRSGIRCGRLLRRIHEIEVTSIQNACNLEHRLSEYVEAVSIRDDLLTKRSTYLPQIQNWRDILCRTYRPALVHLDYVPKNIMIHDNELTVIDWDSCIIADPWMDFINKGLDLVPEKQVWNAAIIDGYFQNEVPVEFWTYFKALTVYALLQSTVWAINRNNTSRVNLIEEFVCDSYDNFERDIPKWYEQDSLVRFRVAQLNLE